MAREFVLNRLPVLLVDRADLASGTTAYSSRLIHGGLRYLEYGEWSLVRESLGERRRLLTLAPHLVRPLRFFIPVENRYGGFLQAFFRFFGGTSERSQSRGLYLVRIGLWLYDWIAKLEGLPNSTMHRAGDPDVPSVDASRYRWLCSYSDAQVLYPERLVVEMLEDARQFAKREGIPFQVLTYHNTSSADGRYSIVRGSTLVADLLPAVVINATGAWVDHTLDEIHLTAKRLIGGTKGSHLVIRQGALRKELEAGAVYVEAEDGRPVFLLPFADCVLVGTTDVRFEGPPESAVADDAEIDYLLSTVNEVVPDCQVTHQDIVLHYSGVRPLPFVESSGATGAISRRHFLARHDGCTPPVYSVIGGKLTTCRSLAEETVETVMRQLGMCADHVSRSRPLPGSTDYPSTIEAVDAEQQRISQALDYRLESVVQTWLRCGRKTESILAATRDRELLAETDIPMAVVRHMITNEWVDNLSDLVERRLMLLYDRRLSVVVLERLAQEIVVGGKMDPEEVQTEVADCRRRLQSHFGIKLAYS